MFVPEENRFTLSESTVYNLRAMEPDFGEIGEFVFYRTYSRAIWDRDPDTGELIRDENGDPVQIGQERWWQVIKRVIEGVMSILKNHYIRNHIHWNEDKWQELAYKMAVSAFKMEWMPPGRGLWAMGTDYVYERGGMALFNCAFVEVRENIGKTAYWAMDALMNGVGVGFRPYRNDLMEVVEPSDENEETYVIPDSREGWCESVQRLIDSYLRPDQPKWTFDYSEIRPEGSPIRGFGGRASGPGPLKKLHERIRTYFRKYREWRNNINPGSEILDPEDEYDSIRLKVDVFNAIGCCVVAGNVRRCMPEGTLVHTERGGIPIERVVPGDVVVTPAGRGTVRKLFKQGVQPTVTVKHLFGEIECTPNHRVAVFTSCSEWTFKRADELQPGDRLVFDPEGYDGVPQKLPEHVETRKPHDTVSRDLKIPELDTEIAWFLGLFHGDGYTFVPGEAMQTPNGYVSISVHEADVPIRERAASAMRKFGMEPSITEHEGRWVSVRAYATNFAKYLKKHVKQPKVPIRVPEWILNAPREIREAYVCGVADADGAYSNRPMAVAASVYEDFLHDLRRVLASLGVASEVRLNRPARGKWQSLYNLNIKGAENRNRFMDMAERFSSKYEGDSRKTTRSAFGFSFPGDFVRNAYKGRWITNNAGITTDRIMVETQAKFAAFPVTVTGVDSSGRSVDTYDIEVEGVHQFTAEGFVVHNSAEISLAPVSDPTFADLKNYEKYPERAEIGWMSNNSVILETPEDFAKLGEIAERVIKNGEPGYLNMVNVKYGRLRVGKASNVREDKATGLNPCGEIALESFEVCNIAETLPTRCKTVEDWFNACRYATIYCSTVNLLPTHSPETNRVVARNRRIGVGLVDLTGWKAAHPINKVTRWLRDGYKLIREVNRELAAAAGIPESIRVTTVKPGGCRPWNGLVTTTGGILTLEEMFHEHPAGEQWAAYSGGERAVQEGAESSKIVRTFDNGKAPVRRIRMSYGIEVESTLNHPWRVAARHGNSRKSEDGSTTKYTPVDQWVKTEDIRLGDVLEIRPGAYASETPSGFRPVNALSIRMRGNVPEIKQPDQMTADVAWLLGYLWGDGSMSPCKYRLRWIDQRMDNLEKAQRILHETFGIDAEIHAASEGKRAHVLEAGSKVLWHWLIVNGVFKYYADAIDVIPEIVRRSTHEHVLAFIAGLIDADGGVSYRPKEMTVNLSTADGNFAKHVQNVSLAVGVVFGRSHNTKGSSRQGQRNMWLMTTAPETLSDRFQMLVNHSTKLREAQATRSLPWSHDREDHKKTRVFGKVQAIEDIGEMPTFDVEVERDHWFYAGAVRSHNTTPKLAGRTSGIGYPTFRHTLMRVRVSETAPVVSVLRDAGVPCEPDKVNPKTLVFEFPVLQGPAKPATEASLWEQAANLMFVQREWADNAVSNCLAPGHLIHTAEGFVANDEISTGPQGFSDSGGLKVVNRNGKIADAPQTYNNGIAETLKVVLEGQREITGTPQHKLLRLADDGTLTWTELADVKPGDRVARRVGLNLWPTNDPASKILKTWEYERKTSSKDVTIPRRMSSDLAFWLGCLVADGHVSENFVQLTQVAGNVSDEWCEISEDIFGVNPHVARDERSDANLLKLTITRTELARWCRWLGVYDELKEKRTPSAILRAGKQAVKAYIRGLTLDGHVSGKHTTVVTTVSRKLAYEVDTLLANFGILGTVLDLEHDSPQQLPNGKFAQSNRPYYCVVLGEIASARFNRIIGFAETRKGERSLARFGESRGFRRNGHVPDFGIRDRFREDVLPTLKSKFLSDHFHSICCHGDKQLSLDTLMQFRDMGLEIPGHLVDPTWDYLTVQSVSLAGDQPTSDISVPDTNSYLVGAGIVSHNTLFFKPKWVLTKAWKPETLPNSDELQGVLFGLHEAMVDPHDAPRILRTLAENGEYADSAIRMTSDPTGMKLYRFNPMHEEDQIEDVLSTLAPVTKSVSLLPHTAAGVYEQSPQEGILEDEYLRRRAAIRPLDWSDYIGSDGEKPLFCTGPHCEESAEAELRAN